MNQNVRTHLALAAVNIFYGANYSIAKISLPAYIEPAGFILLRIAASAILYALAWYFIFRKEAIKIERGDWLPLAWCAFTGVAVNQLLFFKGLAITSPVNASLIITSNPVLVIAVAYFVLKEKITWKKSLGILLGISGRCGSHPCRQQKSNSRKFNAWRFVHSHQLIVLRHLFSAHKTADEKISSAADYHGCIHNGRCDDAAVRHI